MDPNVGLTMVGTSRTIWGTTPLPFDLSGIGMANCLLHVSIDVSQQISTSGGKALWSLPIPNDPAAPGGAITTEGAIAVIGS